jgi:hypothetical protein
MNLEPGDVNVSATGVIASSPDPEGGLYLCTCIECIKGKRVTNPQEGFSDRPIVQDTCPAGTCHHLSHPARTYRDLTSTNLPVEVLLSDIPKSNSTFTMIKVAGPAVPAVITSILFTSLAFLSVALRLYTRIFMLKNAGAGKALFSVLGCLIAS